MESHLNYQAVKLIVTREQNSYLAQRLRFEPFSVVEPALEPVVAAAAAAAVVVVVVVVAAAAEPVCLYEEQVVF